jgi:hypothetical protein
MGLGKGGLGAGRFRVPLAMQTGGYAFSAVPFMGIGVCRLGEESLDVGGRLAGSLGFFLWRCGLPSSIMCSSAQDWGDSVFAEGWVSSLATLGVRLFEHAGDGAFLFNYWVTALSLFGLGERSVGVRFFFRALFVFLGVLGLGAELESFPVLHFCWSAGGAYFAPLADG